MCGKFTQMATWAQVVDFSTPLAPTASEANAIIGLTPARYAYVIHLNDEGDRVVTPMRWGFADNRSRVYSPKPIHARCETVDELPIFAESFAERRGIVMVRTFNEGKEVTPRKTEQWTAKPRDGKPLAIAVIWRRFTTEQKDGAPETYDAFAMITTPPNPTIATVTDRMPAFLPMDDETWQLWLGELRAPLEEVKALLTPYDDDGNWDFAPEPPKPKRPQPPSGDGQPGLL